MSDAAIALPKRANVSFVPAAVAIALLGTAVYGLLVLRSAGMATGAFGADIYDQLWLAILDGRLDLPARVMRMEGHYWPDGTAMTYHGIAPVLTRSLLDPFVIIGAISLAPISVWLWATLGSTAWHCAVLQVGERSGTAPWLLSLLGIAVWLGGPGILLVANHAFYHEPIAVAYATTGAFALVWLRGAGNDRVPAILLVALAALAALTVQARPNVAIGLYIATSLALTRAVWLERRAALPGALAAMAILAAGGAGYLALNTLKFGSTTTVHGGFLPGQVQHGVAYWEMEPSGNARQQAFTEHGRFNTARIAPNAAMYLAAPPTVLAPSANAAAQGLHRAATLEQAGFGRIEGPSGGILFLWSLWVILASIGTVALLRSGRSHGALIIGLGTSALLTLSYPTITLRYHVDLWPLVAGLALLGIGVISGRLLPVAQRALLCIAAVFGIVLSGVTAVRYADFFRTHDDNPYLAEWTEAECTLRAEAKGLDRERIAHVCRDPLIENGG